MASTGDYSHGNPLAHLSESVNAIDPLNAIEKTINEVHTNTHIFIYEKMVGWAVNAFQFSSVQFCYVCGYISIAIIGMYNTTSEC